MTGFLPINKQSGPTSHTITKAVSRLLTEKCAGHAGTLDPMAQGVLPIMLGRATKLLDFLPSDKSYRAVLKLGIKTDTGDITGNIIDTQNVNVTKTHVQNILPHFVGCIDQLPPMYSAIKFDGKPLYKYAREGITIERKIRSANIYEIELISCDENEDTYEIDVACSKGTYIRTLCEDIGEKLGVCATMLTLLRTSAYGFDLNNSFTLDEIQAAVQNNQIEGLIKLPCDVFSYLPKVVLPDDGLKFYLNGGFISQRRFETPLGCDLFRAYDTENVFLGLCGKEFCDDEFGVKAAWLSEV